MRCGVAEHDRRIVEARVLAVTSMVAHTYDALVGDKERIGFAPGVDRAAGLADEVRQALAQGRRSAAHIVAAAREIRRLRNRISQERHAVRIVVVVTEIRRQRDFDRLVRAEQLVQHLADSGTSLADQRPDTPDCLGGMAKPPALIVLVQAQEADRFAHRGDAPEVFVQRVCVLRKPLRERGIRGAHAMGQGERWADQRSAHLVEIAHIHEGQSAVEAKRMQQRAPWRRPRPGRRSRAATPRSPARRGDTP